MCYKDLTAKHLIRGLKKQTEHLLLPQLKHSVVSDQKKLFQKEKKEGSQEGELGGRGIHVSSQLGHLPGTDGGPQTPKVDGRNPQ